MNPEKLAKLQAQVRIGGKGSVRRKTKRVHKAAVDDKKVQNALKKVNVQPIPAIEEVNFFQEDGTILHVAQPKVQGAIQANTFLVGGTAEIKDMSELMPGILAQLGRESMEQLSRLAASFQAANPSGAAPNADDDDEIPELVEDFEASGIKGEVTA